MFELRSKKAASSIIEPNTFSPSQSAYILLQGKFFVSLPYQLDLTEDYLNMDDDWDNVSVASLALPMTQRSSNTVQDSSKNSQAPDDPDSPEALVKAKNRNVDFVKRTFLIILVAAGIGFSIGAYFTQDGDDKGDEEEQEENADENNGLLYAGVIGATFFVLVIVFLRYDFLVSRRQSLVLDMATRSKHIVDSLFPSMVRDRLMQEADGRRPSNSSRQSDEEYGHGGEVDYAKLTKMNTMANQRMQDSSKFTLPLPLTDSPTKIKKFLAVNVESSRNVGEKDGKPIADLYPSATVFFADIAGFTSWSAEREPTQVFTLLETVYNEFDAIADNLGVFKVSGRCAELGWWPIAYCTPACQLSHSTMSFHYRSKQLETAIWLSRGCQSQTKITPLPWPALPINASPK